MKLRLKIKRTLRVEPDVLEQKINTYLTTNSYRITETGSGYIIFAEDEFSDRRRSRSDFHNRIGEGKFEYESISKEETNVRLIYLTSISEYILIVLFFSAIGIYTNNIIMPIVFSFAFTMPILYKIYCLNLRVFEEIMED